MGIGWNRLRGERADLPDWPRRVEKSGSEENPAGEKGTETTRLLAGLGFKYPERTHRARRGDGTAARAEGAGAGLRAQGREVCAKRSEALVPAWLCRPPEQSTAGVGGCIPSRAFARSQLT